MVFFWSAAAQIAAKMDRLKVAEQNLLQIALSRSSLSSSSNNNDNISVQAIDTTIRSNKIITTTNQQQEEEYIIHSIHVTSNNNKHNNSKEDEKETKPLVVLHGYMNGGAYFYRNLIGLGRIFQNVHALDLLGWGLSSRPNFPKLTIDEKNPILTTTIAEDFYVESLESWRKEHNIDTMILAGHSMGGYISVAYTERYPQHVDKLILISPVGVPVETQQHIEKRNARKQQSWKHKFFYNFFEGMFPRYSPGDLLRTLPESTSRNRIQQYVTFRLPAITDKTEQDAISNYLYESNTLPGSGEYCLPYLLRPSIYAHNPLQYRIPKLINEKKINSCTFLYGEHDWMDSTGGLLVQQQVERDNLSLKHKNTVNPVRVYQIRDAGHLLMLENSDEFNIGIALAVDRQYLIQEQNNNKVSFPVLLKPSQLQQQQTTRPTNLTGQQQDEVSSDSYTGRQQVPELAQ